MFGVAMTKPISGNGKLVVMPYEQAAAMAVVGAEVWYKPKRIQGAVIVLFGPNDANGLDKLRCGDQYLYYIKAADDEH